MDQNKGDLRKKFKLELKDLSVVAIKEKSALISSKLCTLLEEILILRSSSVSQQIVIGAYAPLVHEVQWHKHIEMFASFSQMLWAFPCLANNADSNFPKINQQQMEYYLSSWDQLIPSTEFGIQVLVPSRMKDKRVVPDLLLIPGLAFSSLGERLGRGGGFFDRYLKNYQGLKIGLCFSGQFIPALPTESHDQKMDVVITENDVHRMLREELNLNIARGKKWK